MRKDVGCMVRQCAWCLCLINTMGERVSLSPSPKIYEATHGICGICGIRWIEQVLETDLTIRERLDNGYIFPDIERQEPHEIHETITKLMLYLQQNAPVPLPIPVRKPRKHTRTF